MYERNGVSYSDEAAWSLSETQRNAPEVYKRLQEIHDAIFDARCLAARVEGKIHALEASPEMAMRMIEVVVPLLVGVDD